MDVQRTFRRLTLALLWAFSLPAFAASDDLPNRQSTAGGIVIVELAKDKLQRPEARYLNKRVMVLQRQGKWLAVVGIPLTASPGTHKLKVKAAGTVKWTDINFIVKDKPYAQQRLTIKNPRKVNPTQSDMRVIRKDDSKIARAKSTWSDEIVSTHLDIPVKGRRSSEFGLERFYNNAPRKPHSGIDIAAKEGTQILAPADGIVVEADNFFFSGNCIFIDHGQGLLTFYAHMNKITIKKGQRVKRGEKIGEVGQTGRATGPHLHWSIALNQTWVDPDLFLN